MMYIGGRGWGQRIYRQGLKCLSLGCCFKEAARVVLFWDIKLPSLIDPMWTVLTLPGHVELRGFFMARTNTGDIWTSLIPWVPIHSPNYKISSGVTGSIYWYLMDYLESCSCIHHKETIRKKTLGTNEGGRKFYPSNISLRDKESFVIRLSMRTADRSLCTKFIIHHILKFSFPRGDEKLE